MEERINLWGFTGLSSLVSYLTGSFTPLIYVMMVFAVFDFITEISVIKKRGGSIKDRGIMWFVLGKFYYFMIVAVAFGFDLMIILSTDSHTNFEWNNYFGVLAIMYLTVNEGLSILENLEEFDVKLPFLNDSLKTFKKKLASKKSNKDLK